MFEIPDWPAESPNWEGKYLDLLKECSTSTISPVTVESLIELSDAFPIKFPVETARCKTLLNTVKKETLERNINSAYPLLHESTLYLYAKFLLYKQKYGTEIEKRIYKDMLLTDFIQRLLEKRAVMFMGRFDSYVLMDSTKGAGKWNTIGKANEKSPLVLKNYISYDEIKLSALLSVSSYNYAINYGDRKNKGVVAKSRTNIQPESIVIGLIGARLKKRGVMECQEMVITNSQNIPQNGYGDSQKDTLPTVFSSFYQEPSFTYDDVKNRIDSDNSGRFTKLRNDEFFDNALYAKRLALSFDTLLLEANHRAKEAASSAYIHLVGIGLGVWKTSDHQKDVFVETFLKRISSLGEKLHHVSDVDFAYFGDGITCKNYKEGYKVLIKRHPQGGVKVHVSKREPYTKVPGKLLVVSYAWDGNALPGNEYWKGALCSTGDSSTASSTQVTELHNPHINKMVCADNLMVVTPDGHVSIRDYINKFKTGPWSPDNAKSSKRKKT